jgi:hypothetical protein
MIASISVRYFGAKRSGEPGIHVPIKTSLRDPELAGFARPGMTEQDLGSPA